MLQEITTQIFTVTPEASQAVKDILAQRNLEGYALRVYVSSGGCSCGVNFGMALDNNFRDADQTFESNGVKVVVDEVSVDYLRGATIDFINDPQQGQGFAVRDVNASKHEHDEGGCSCGSSCSCNS